MKNITEFLFEANEVRRLTIEFDSGEKFEATWDYAEAEFNFGSKSNENKICELLAGHIKEYIRKFDNGDYDDQRPYSLDIEPKVKLVSNRRFSDRTLKEVENTLAVLLEDNKKSRDIVRKYMLDFSMGFSPAENRGKSTFQFIYRKSAFPLIQCTDVI